MTPTMVTLAERAQLRDWVALNWVGQGEVVEIGTFCGGSAIAILQGMEAAKWPKPLHVYDVFEFPEGGHEKAYRELVPIEGKSFRAVFDFVTKNWAHRLRVTQGDASKHSWVCGPIEFLHLDCSISSEFHEAIAREFYPHLIVGGTLAHQDFTYEKAPFIAEMMGKLERFFNRVARVGTTVYFTVKEEMSRESIEAALA